MTTAPSQVNNVVSQGPIPMVLLCGCQNVQQMWYYILNEMASNALLYNSTEYSDAWETEEMQHGLPIFHAPIHEVSIVLVLM